MELGFASMAKSVPDAPADRTPKKRALRKLPVAELSPDDLPAIFGRNLRVARVKRGLTLAEVAEAIETTPQYVSLIENGKKNVTLGTMKKLAEIAGCDLSDMIRLAVDGGKPSSDAQSESD